MNDYYLCFKRVPIGIMQQNYPMANSFCNMYTGNNETILVIVAQLLQL